MSETHHCHSCGMQIATQPYCDHCTDEQGKLRPFEEMFERMVQWALGQNPALSREDAEAQTREYMRGKPAWADHPGLVE